MRKPAPLAPGVARVVTRLRHGEPMHSWDVHHTSLRRAVAQGLVVCDMPSCRLSLVAEPELARAAS